MKKSTWRKNNDEVCCDQLANSYVSQEVAKRSAKVHAVSTIYLILWWCYRSKIDHAFFILYLLRPEYLSLFHLVFECFVVVFLLQTTIIYSFLQEFVQWSSQLTFSHQRLETATTEHEFDITCENNRYYQGDNIKQRSKVQNTHHQNKYKNCSNACCV